MTRGKLPLAALLAAFGAFALVPLLPAVASANGTVVRIGPSETKARFLAIGRGKSVVVELPRDAKDVLVANPAIANAVVRSARRAFLIGVETGQTNVVFFDADGAQIAAFDIEVGRDVSGVQEALRKLMPGANIRADHVQDSVVLSGSVATAAEAQQVVDIATKLVGDAKVVNGLTIRAKEQVMLRVVVSEVRRDVVKQFGIDLTAAVQIGSAVVNLSTVNPFALGGPLSNSAAQVTATGRRFDVDAVVRAMEQAGVMRTLAEPNLTAISGEGATFLAGGEFPIIGGRSFDPNTGIWTNNIEWKKFGVVLDFTPVVLSEGRISLRVQTEVSELAEGVESGGIRIPGLTVRRASSTVELPSGGSLVLAGLIKEETRQGINGTPGLLNIPILGTLFRSRDFQNRQTELMIIITPYTVNAVARQDLQRPDEGFAAASDPSTILLGRLNRIYGIAGKIDPRRPYHGTYGFIID